MVLLMLSHFSTIFNLNNLNREVHHTHYRVADCGQLIR
jgi:hypothetical protein